MRGMTKYIIEQIAHDGRRKVFAKFFRSKSDAKTFVTHKNRCVGHTYKLLKTYTRKRLEKCKKRCERKNRALYERESQEQFLETTNEVQL